MDPKSETLLLHRDCCLEMAETAPTEAVRDQLISIARLYEGEVGPIERLRDAIAGGTQPIGENSEHPHAATWQESLAALPRAIFGAGETVMRQGTKSGRLLILRSGAVSVVKNGIEIAKVAEPGAVFGELSALLNQPHTADVRTINSSEFHIADASILLTREAAALLYVATLLARRLDLANRGLIEMKSELAAVTPLNRMRSAFAKIESMLSFIGADYVSTGTAHPSR
jgi:CRP/FNR family transcriptional regulator, cyclic AMP receptor protein